MGFMAAIVDRSYLRLDYAEYGCAPLIGCDGVSSIAMAGPIFGAQKRDSVARDRSSKMSIHYRADPGEGSSPAT